MTIIFVTLLNPCKSTCFITYTYCYQKKIKDSTLATQKICKDDLRHTPKAEYHLQRKEDLSILYIRKHAKTKKTL